MYLKLEYHPFTEQARDARSASRHDGQIVIGVLGPKVGAKTEIAKTFINRRWGALMSTAAAVNLSKAKYNLTEEPHRFSRRCFLASPSLLYSDHSICPDLKYRPCFNLFDFLQGLGPKRLSA